MKSEELRSIQKPIKDRYRETPQAALVTLKAEGHIGENVSCSVQTGRALVEAGLHPASGGSGLAACSGDMLLQALVACAGVTLASVATALGIELRDGIVRAEGDLDSDASDEQLATLIRLTERYCVVFQTLRQPPEMEMSYGREKPS
jgi:uncharacterized OsmC-like protein